MFEELGLAEFTDEDVDACVRAHGSLDVPALPSTFRDSPRERIMDGGLTALDAVRALAERGYELEAERVLEMIRQRLLGDVLQTSAILDEDLNVLSSLTDPNDYAGPGHRVPHVAAAPPRGGQRPAGVVARRISRSNRRARRAASACASWVRPTAGDARG